MKCFGIRGVIGKGGMGPKTLAGCAKNGCVCLHSIGGAAQVLAEHITKVRNVYFEEVRQPRGDLGGSYRLPRGGRGPSPTLVAAAIRRCWMRISEGVLLPAVDEIEDGHPDGDAVGDLFENHRPFAIGNVTFDLLRGSLGRGADHGLGLGERETFAVQAEERAYSPMLGNIVLRWRSCWMRRRLITSASTSASSRL